MMHSFAPPAPADQSAEVLYQSQLTFLFSVEHFKDRLDSVM